MNWFKKKDKLEELSNTVSTHPVGFVTEETATNLAELLSKYDLVSVEPNDGNPFVIVSERGGSNPTFSAGSVEHAWPLTYGSDQPFPGFIEPAADARASGAQIRAVQQGAQARTGSSVQLADSSVPTGMASYGKKAVSIGELGSSSPSPWTSFTRREYNNDLIGLKGLQVYDKMRRNDGVVRGTLRGVKTPVLAARWFMEPDDEEKVADVNAAEFVWKNLTKYMGSSWPQFLTEALLSCDFGYYMFEIVWEDTVFEGQDRLMVKKLSPRHPMDVKEWVYDANGGPVGVVMFPNDGNIYDNDIFIEIEKLLVFTFDQESGNIEGISVLRSAYKHWYFKEQLYKIDAIQKERHGIGVPVIKLPPSFNEQDKLLADEIGRNLRTNERAHIALPYLWEMFFAKLEGQPVNALESIDQHDDAIRENVLLGFQNSKYATSEDDQIMFLKATRFIADIVCSTINKHLIPRMIDANFSRVGNPELKARRIGESADWRTLSFAIRNLIGSGALVPDDKLEEMLRDEMDLPKIDIKTRRVVSTGVNPNDQEPQKVGAIPGSPEAKVVQDANAVIPSTKQNGAVAGLPRQSKLPSPPGMRPNAGRDNSGGN